jgi:hypothetical protein
MSSIYDDGPDVDETVDSTPSEEDTEKEEQEDIKNDEDGIVNEAE